jgi:hypothetical protein
MKEAVNRGENTQPIVHVLHVRQQGIVRGRLLGRRLRTPVRQQAQFLGSEKGRRAVRADWIPVKLPVNLWAQTLMDITNRPCWICSYMRFNHPSESSKSPQSHGKGGQSYRAHAIQPSPCSS